MLIPAKLNSNYDDVDRVLGAVRGQIVAQASTSSG
jgi:hypothetical protein